MKISLDTHIDMSSVLSLRLFLFVTKKDFILYTHIQTTNISFDMCPNPSILPVGHVFGVLVKRDSNQHRSFLCSPI